jgi:hypothetical protein
VRSARDTHTMELDLQTSAKPLYNGSMVRSVFDVEIQYL